jgi:hypothetical protein
MADTTPRVGLAEVDKIILLALEKQLTFPVGTSRWRILAWAAEALELRRNDPARFARDGLRDLHAQHFPSQK